jgi:hypothetical protein
MKENAFLRVDSFVFRPQGQTIHEIARIMMMTIQNSAAKHHANWAALASELRRLVQRLGRPSHYLFKS